MAASAIHPPCFRPALASKGQRMFVRVSQVLPTSMLVPLTTRVFRHGFLLFDGQKSVSLRIFKQHRLESFHGWPCVEAPGEALPPASQEDRISSWLEFSGQASTFVTPCKRLLWRKDIYMQHHHCAQLSALGDAELASISRVVNASLSPQVYAADDQSGRTKHAFSEYHDSAKKAVKGFVRCPTTPNRARFRTQLCKVLKRNDLLVSTVDGCRLSQTRDHGQ